MRYENQSVGDAARVVNNGKIVTSANLEELAGKWDAADDVL